MYMVVPIYCVRHIGNRGCQLGELLIELSIVAIVRASLISGGYLARTRDKASDDPISIPLGYRVHSAVWDRVLCDVSGFTTTLSHFHESRIPLLLRRIGSSSSLKSCQFYSWPDDASPPSVPGVSRRFPQAPKGVSGGPLKRSSATRRLLEMDLILLNHGQVTRATPDLEPLFLATTSQQRTSAPSEGWVFSGTRLELMTRKPRVRKFDP
ncbi:hypothetical protein TNCV_129571 [Trichonephila clavipes]|nr:hypothetical protein TNCV_129571 [Trichonephila clavipes]